MINITPLSTSEEPVEAVQAQGRGHHDEQVREDQRLPHPPYL